MTVQMPNLIRKTCSICRSAQTHTVSQVKRGAPFRHTHSAIERQKKRRMGIGNGGKFSKVPAGRVKTSKKPHILLECKVCHHKSNTTRPRTNKFEIRVI